ncbi:MAG: hypothetical protein P8R31_08195 [Mariniblastus sp.]|nr:hypothetical protein [Mariniblastus sp.]
MFRSQNNKRYCYAIQAEDVGGTKNRPTPVSIRRSPTLIVGYLAFK